MFIFTFLPTITGKNVIIAMPDIIFHELGSCFLAGTGSPSGLHRARGMIMRYAGLTADKSEVAAHGMLADMLLHCGLEGVG